MIGTGSDGQNTVDDGALAHSVFVSMTFDDPLFLKLKELLLTGRRTEALRLICEHDNRFEDPQAKQLVSLIMSTLRDTMIDTSD